MGGNGNKGLREARAWDANGSRMQNSWEVGLTRKGASSFQKAMGHWGEQILSNDYEMPVHAYRQLSTEIEIGTGLCRTRECPVCPQSAMAAS